MSCTPLSKLGVQSQSSMRSMLDYVFGWEVFSLGVGLLLVAGSLTVSDEFKKYTAAKIFFCLAAIWIFGKILMWSFLTSEKFTVRTTIAFLACGFVGAGLAEAVRLIGQRESKADPPTTQQGKPKVPDIQQKSEGSYSPNIVGDGNVVTINPAPILQEKSKGSRGKQPPAPPVVDLQAGSHIRFDDSKIVAHEGSAVRTGKGIKDLSFNNTLIEGGAKAGARSKDAPTISATAITPEIQYQESSPEEIAALRESAIALIKNLFDSYTDWRKREREWLDKKNEAKADEVSKQFTDGYDQNYRQRVIETRDSLLRSVKQRPKRPSHIEVSYRPHGEYIFPDVVQTHLCDLIVLLNEMEKENSFEISCADVKRKIAPFCDEGSMD